MGNKRSFFLGFICHICLASAMQDLYGLEGYIAVVRASWMNTSWWMWAVLGIIAICLDCVYDKLERRREETK